MWVQSWRRDANQYVDLRAVPVHVEREARAVGEISCRERRREKKGGLQAEPKAAPPFNSGGEDADLQERKDGGRGTGRNPREWTALPVREDRVQGRRVRRRAQEGRD